MGHLSIRWLLSELPKLEKDGVIDGAAAARIRAHYGEPAAFSSSRLAVAVFAVFGALLIGSGVILLLAHNWEHLGRGTRAAISLTPLLISQIFVGWVVLRRFGSTAWREGSATLLALAVAAALALVDQTYHTGGDLESFLWRWALLLAPLPWLLNSTAVAMIFLAALTWWAGAAKVEGSEVLWLWPVAAAVVPHVIQVLRSDHRGLRAANLQWAIALFVCVAAGLGLEHRVPGLWIVVYVGLFALMITLGAVNRRDEDGLWRRPLEAVGIAGSVGLWLILSFDEPWRHIGWNHIHTTERFHEVASWMDVLLAVGVPLAAIAAMALLLDRKRHGLQLLWCLSVPLVAVVWPVVAATDSEWIGAVAFNLLLFGVGIATIAAGLKTQSLATVNLGMVVVATLVVVRFFDSGFGFILKGFAFILVGIGFLVANFVLSRRLREIPEEDR
ncbi:MAG: DUF2157 domain-containing protein [Acidobacteria bacterium]|nr:DUF2157 domain-containing protein [Candidatus Sulfomarinibacter sp. MAG AM2]